MDKDLLTSVDEYVIGQLIPADVALDAALRESEAAGLPAIAVTPNLGKFLYLTAKLQAAISILEIGTLGGYSTIWLARGLAPGGRLVTLEVDAQHAEVARANLARAGLSEVVDVRLGPALTTLPQLAAEDRGPFDLVFVDADKENCAPYFDWAVKLSRPGGLILVDNVIRQGEILNAASTDPRVQGVRRLFDALATDHRVTATALQTAGAKGHDGIILAVVN
jgi:predicted O-methyltransferase YrrM